MNPRGLAQAGMHSKKTWSGPLPWLLMSLPLFGLLFVLTVYLLQPKRHPAYRHLEDRLSFWSDRSRAVLTQLYILHASQAGLGPTREFECGLALQQGDDFSACVPKSPERAKESAKLLSSLADFVLENTPPRQGGPNRLPAETYEMESNKPPSSAREWDPEAI